MIEGIPVGGRNGIMTEMESKFNLFFSKKLAF